MQKYDVNMGFVLYKPNMRVLNVIIDFFHITFTVCLSSCGLVQYIPHIKIIDEQGTISHLF